ncbi:hypothetical protein ABZY03_15600 [Streptomyces klenkii]|uniref:hypothetical protein n=1 Tax=Streptomyces klenkii TaxID=1420899 RepID=UPI0033AC31DF
MESDGDAPQGESADSADPARAGRTLQIAEVTTRPVAIRCMGRSYRASAQGDTVLFHDVTDITRPIALGAAHRTDNGTWDVVTARGRHLPPATELLPVLVALRHAYWP